MRHDSDKERRSFIAETARDFLAKHWPNCGPDMAGSAVEYACKLADALEKTSCAPWGATIDIVSDDSSRPIPYTLDVATDQD